MPDSVLKAEGSDASPAASPRFSGDLRLVRALPGRMPMDQCRECGNEIVDCASVCTRCGHPARDHTPVLPFDAPEPDDDMVAEGAVPVEAAAGAEATPAGTTPPRPSNRRALILVATAAGIAGLVTLALLRAHGTPLSDAAAIEASPAQPVAVVHVEAPTTTAYRWSTDNRTLWLGPAGKGVVLDVAAENTVGVWMRNVRPALVVRCIGGRTEVFVFTQSSARIEPGTDDHTVTLGIDESSEMTELWPDSIEHDALFAPDGAALAKRLLGARTLRFGFTPHNAAPVAAHFHVAGLEELLRPSARECGWR